MTLKILLSLSYAIGLIFAAMAVLRSRTPQGATAWVMALLSFPMISVPLYLLFGRNKFEGYNTKRKILDSHIEQEYESLILENQDYFTHSEEMQILSNLVTVQGLAGFTKRNKIDLLINGDETYPEMLRAIEEAENYIVFQFYILCVDQTGRMFFNLLKKKALEGVRVTIMSDAVGARLPRKYLRELEKAGIKIGTFNESSIKGKFQINFRNHRKILIVDGKVAFLGGINIGNDYLGLNRRIGEWRDTHVKIQGPAVIAAQLASAKDWYFIHNKRIDVDWKIYPSQENSAILVLSTGPADATNNCLLSFISLINSATKRLWIANPYFVPPESLMDAIILARIRGVDVRIIIPGKTDALMVALASRVYQSKLVKHGIKLYRYDKGFLHQKTMVIDEEHAVVGSVNFDCRSMFINFEVSAISNDRKFVQDCTKMFERDFLDSKELGDEDIAKNTLGERIVCRGANLLAPIL